MADDYDDDMVADSGARLASGMVIVTGLILIFAIVLMWKVTGDQYGIGMMAP